MKSYSKSWLAIRILVSAAVLAIPFTAQTARAAGPWYVTPAGEDGNSCSDIANPCATINGAIGKASPGDTIYVAIGKYTSSTGDQVVLIEKSITLSGGWDAAFTTQSGLSTIDGETTRRGISTNANPVVVDHFRIQHGFSNEGSGIVNYGNGTLTLNNSVVNSNISNSSGGGISNSGTLTINNTTISSNTAGDPCCTGGGGGGGLENRGTVTLNNSTVSDNILLSMQGSAINTSGPTILNNTTVSGNKGGAAIDVFVGSLVLNNSTIYHQGFGFANAAGQVSLKNTIIAGSVSFSDCYNDTNYAIGTVTSYGYNLIGNGTNCSLTPTTGDMIGSSANPIGPGLGALQDNGGPTFTHALSPRSPALNAGNPALPGSGENACLVTDQRGIPRPEGDTCDIGAYEGTGTFQTLFLPVFTKYDPAEIMDEYSFTDRCGYSYVTYNGMNVAKVNLCVSKVRIRNDGQMYFDMHWSVEFLDPRVENIYKYSDVDNRNMYITDNLGNRYDHVATGGAAANLTYFYPSGPSNADGWYMFPARTPGATIFTFHVDDEGYSIGNIVLSH